MTKAKPHAKMPLSNVILGIVSFMTGFLIAAIAQKVVFGPKRRKENAPCNVCFTQNDMAKRTKHRKKDDNNEYFSSFDMKAGLGDV